MPLSASAIFEEIDAFSVYSFDNTQIKYINGENVSIIINGIVNMCYSYAITHFFCSN